MALGHTISRDVEAAYRPGELLERRREPIKMSVLLGGALTALQASDNGRKHALTSGGIAAGYGASGTS